MPSEPPIPTGSDREATWFQWVHQTLRGLRFNNSPTVKVSRGPDGIYFDSSPPGGNGTTLKLYAVTQLYGVATDGTEDGIDYIGATPWDVNANGGDGGTSGAQIFIAKCMDGRQPALELIDGATIQYTYVDDNHRVATPQLTGVENHVMHRRYIAYDEADPDPNVANGQVLIFVERSQNGTGVLDPSGQQIRYLEIQPNREWALASS
jgi:hypothetical protein